MPTNPPSPGRRSALQALLAGTLGATIGAGCTRSNRPLAGSDDRSDTPPPGATTDRDLDLHLVRRLTFGATPALLAEVRTTGREIWFDRQLDPAGLDTSDVDGAVAAAHPDLERDAGDLLEEVRTDGGGPQLGAALTAALLTRHTQSPAQLHERMVELWADHFNVPFISPPIVAARVVMDREVLRPHALGRFDDLLVATAQSPAMLLYLDNARSTAGSINENYARELLELHTVGVDGGYTEDDIVAVARLLTGWGVDRDLGFRFRPARHDRSEVSMLGWTRPSSGDPLDHGVEFLHHLARLPATATHVSRRIARRFVADDPDEDLVSAMAAAWEANDTAITPVIRAMVAHPAFDAAPPKLNRPWDHLVQTMRSLGATADVTRPQTQRQAVGVIRNLGQIPFRWAAPDGYPDTADAWANAGGLLARWNLAALLTGDPAPTFATGLGATVDDLRGQPAGAVLDGLAIALRGETPSASMRELLSAVSGWSDDRVPADADLDDTAPLLAFALVAGPEAMFR